jgi:hypothetical protein
MDIEIVNNRYLCPDCSQHDCICRLLINHLCLICEKKVYICNKLIKTDWDLPLPSSPSMLLSLSDFDCILLPKTIPVPVPKTYAVVVSTTVSNE